MSSPALSAADRLSAHTSPTSARMLFREEIDICDVKLDRPHLCGVKLDRSHLVDRSVILQ